MMLLTVLAVLAIVGVAAYCMVCEQLADIHAATPPPRRDVGAGAHADATV